jgi:hypothetical protein
MSKIIREVKCHFLNIRVKSVNEQIILGGKVYFPLVSIKAWSLHVFLRQVETHFSFTTLIKYFLDYYELYFVKLNYE